MGIQAVSQGLDLQQLQQHAATAQTAQSGNVAGMRVETAEDPVSALQNSAEELTFSRDNSRQTKLADRKQKSARTAQEELLKRIQQLQQTVEHADNDAKKQALRRFRESGSKDPKQLLSGLNSLGGHASADYAFLLNEAEATVDEQEKQLLQQAAADLFAANSADIQAVLNTLPELAHEDFAPGLLISQTYSELAAKPHEPAELLRFIGEKFGKEHLSAGIEAMFRALASDLHSAAPSRQTELLNDIASALGQTKTLNASLGLAGEFTSRVTGVLGLKTEGLSPDKLLGSLLNLSQNRFIAPLHVHNLYKNEVAAQDPEQEVLVGQEFLKMLRKLPIELFDSLEQRSKLVDATQKLVDELIDKEDAWLEEGS